MKFLKFASIDVGSNAVRLLITNVFNRPEGPVFRKLSLLRVPIRLGEDAFTMGEIGEDKADQLVKTMMSFKHLMEVHEAIDYKAYATSAFREASNGHDLVRRIKYYSGLDLEILTGDQEAETISTEFIPDHLPRMSEAVFIDVGGGSTELTFLKDGHKEINSSFKIGTIRMLHDQVTSDTWKEFQDWFDQHGLTNSKTPIIGSGGNINKLLKMLRRKSDDYHIYVSDLDAIYGQLKVEDVDERVVKYILNPDRADVIVPACEIFLRVAERMQTQEVYIPKVGLSDGIARMLYKDYIVKLETT